TRVTVRPGESAASAVTTAPVPAAGARAGAAELAGARAAVAIRAEVARTAGSRRGMGISVDRAGRRRGARKTRPLNSKPAMVYCKILQSRDLATQRGLPANAPELHLETDGIHVPAVHRSLLGRIEARDVDGHEGTLTPWQDDLDVLGNDHVGAPHDVEGSPEA